MMVEQDVFLRIVRIADTLTRRMNDVLQPFQLTLVQFSVLDSLRHAGDAGLACGEIAARLVTRDPDITRLLDRLELRGLVSRRRDRPDRRVVRTHLTDEGRQLLAEVDKPMGRLRARHLAPMGKRSLDALGSLLRAAEAAG
jgi:DNA-binding MarR family transcriptional regulator